MTPTAMSSRGVVDGEVLVMAAPYAEARPSPVIAHRHGAPLTRNGFSVTMCAGLLGNYSRSHHVRPPRDARPPRRGADALLPPAPALRGAHGWHVAAQHRSGVHDGAAPRARRARRARARWRNAPW